MMGSLSLGVTRRPLMVLPPLKFLVCHCYFMFSWDSPLALWCWEQPYEALGCGSSTTRGVGASFIIVITGWSSNLQLYPAESPWGVFESFQDSLQMFFFLLQELRAGTNSSGPVVLVTNHTVLTEIVWWLFHCRYRSVWVGILYSNVLRLLSGWGITKMSRMGMGHLSWSLLQCNVCTGL